MKRRSLLLAAALAAFGVSQATLAQQPIVIKFSHVVANDTPKGHAAEFFKKRADELTKGKVKVEVYANSTLYKDKEEMEALQLGAVQMLAPSLAKFGPLGVKEFEVFDLPYIFDDYNDLHKVTQGAVGQQLLAKLEPKGIKGLAYWDNGLKVFSSNKPIKTVADFKGQKMRIQSSKVLDGADARTGQRFRRSWPSPRSIRRCRRASSTAPRIRRRTCTRRRCMKCRSSSASPTTATSATP